MVELLSTIPLLLINSLLFGFFTKLADLLDEHGLKMFKGADIFFGFVWGIFGTLAIIFSPLLATFYLAMLINWIIRGRIDYLNHRIATAIILVSVFFSGILANLDQILFIITTTLFTGIGVLIDYKIIKRNFLTNNNLFIFIALVIMIYSNLNYWIVFVSYLLNSIAYQSVKTWGKRNLKNY